MSVTPGARIKLTALTKRYLRSGRSLDVLRGIDLEVSPGEFLALMGPSGSGKSTLLHLIGGIDRPDSGGVEVGDTRIDRLSGRQLSRWRARSVGFVFQFYHLISSLSAARNVEVPLLLTGLSRTNRRERIEIALALAGLEGRQHHRPRELSGGELQRVGIARALVADPDVLLCDEPTGDLDQQHGDAILSLLRALAEREGKTIVMVTHDPRAAASALRVVSLHEGSLHPGSAR